MNNEDEITDPSDWKATQAPFMSAIEGTLTCHICKELMTAPVLTSCCHTFCSLCIRTSLNTDNTCPICRKELQTSALRKNNIVEELVDIYRPSRKRLFTLLETVSSDHQKASTPRARKRQRTHDDEQSKEPDSEPDLETGDGGQGSYNDSNNNDKNSNSEDDDFEITKVELKTPEKTNDKDLGECPICMKRMPIAEIEQNHIASCLANTNEDTTKSTPSFFRKRESKIDMTKKIGFVAYNLYKEADLRTMLKSMGLPTTGSKQQMQDRHTEWVTLWNANADAKAPVSKKVLLDRLKEWERIMEKENASRRRKQKDKQPELDAEEWSKIHSSAFDELIAKARGNTRGKV